MSDNIFTMLIREIINRSVKKLVGVFIKRRGPPPKLTHLDQMAGMIDLKTRKKTHFAEHIDDIYLTD